ncbi:hypothetical protein ACFQ9X_35500 [Catenulispora yoronensis]
MQHHTENVIVGRKPDEGEPQHGTVLQVEGAVGALGNELARLLGVGSPRRIGPP